MKQSVLLSLLVALLSAGWLLPLTWSASLYLDYLNQIYLPKLQGHVPMASAPLDKFALMSFWAACIWLFVVTAAWAFVAHRSIKRGAA